jgi:hypothetical protein
VNGRSRLPGLSAQPAFYAAERQGYKAGLSRGRFLKPAPVRRESCRWNRRTFIQTPAPGSASLVDDRRPNAALRRYY